MPGGWLLPTLGYVLFVGILGIASKLALRQISWQGLVLFTAAGYALTLIVVVGRGMPLRAKGDGGKPTLDWGMAVLAGLIPALATICLFVALQRGSASRVVPIGAAYPLVTVILAALFLSEGLTWTVAVGAVLVVAGVVLVSLS